MKRGKTKNPKQRYLCQQPKCPARTLILDDDYHGYLPEAKKRIIEMALRQQEIRDTARVLEISPNTGISELKKRSLPRIDQPSGARTLESEQYGC